MAAPPPPPRGRAPQPLRVLADGWYSWEIPSFRPVTDLIARWPRPLQALTWRVGPLRAAVLHVASARYDVLAVTRTDIGWRSLLLMRALLGRVPKLVVLHFIDHPPRTRGAARWVDRAWRPLDRWATRRAVRAAQVLSAWEPELYANRFGTELGRFRFIPFAWRTPGSGGELPPASDSNLVASAGRAFCDWPTLFEAARGRSWALLVVCGEHDRAVVEGLNVSGRADVLVDVPHQRAREMLRGATVCVLCMHEAGVSQGQVRLRDAIDAGAAVVASRTRSLEGYVRDGRTAVLVPPGDPEGLRRAVEELLVDPARRDRLRTAAFERAARWTWQDYLRAIEAFVRGDWSASVPTTD